MTTRDLSAMSTFSIVSKAFSVLAERHDRGLSDDEIRKSLYHQATWAAIAKALGSNRKCSILDIGGGNGIWTVHLARLGHRVTYVDIAEGMARKASANVLKAGVSANIIVADAHNLEFLPSNCFDVVLAVGDLLCYSKSPREICYQAYKRCKPKGKMVVAVMGRFGVLQHLVDSLTVEQVKEYLHSGWWTEFSQNELESVVGASLVAHTYTVKELKKLCLSAGWQIDSFFGAGILRTLLGWKGLMSFVERVGIEIALGLEEELARFPTLLDFAMEFGVICQKRCDQLGYRL